MIFLITRAIFKNSEPKKNCYHLHEKSHFYTMKKMQWSAFFVVTLLTHRYQYQNSLSILTAIIQVNLGLPVFIEAKNDGGGGDNWTTGAISRTKLQSNHHHQQTNIQFLLQAGCPSCHPTNSVKALKGKYHIPWTCLPQAHLEVFQLCLWPLIAPGYLGEGCHASHQPSDASTQCHKLLILLNYS